MRKASIVLLFFLLISCKEVQDIEFIKVQRVEFIEVRDGNVIAVAHAIFNNPNSRGGKVKKVDINVSVRDRESAKVLREEPFKVSPNSEFTIPLDLEISFKELASNFLNSLRSREREKTIPLHFSGHIWITVYGVTRKVPVDYDASLNYRL